MTVKKVQWRSAAALCSCQRITDCCGCRELPSMFFPTAKQKLRDYQSEDVMVVIFRQQWFLWKIIRFFGINDSVWCPGSLALKSRCTSGWKNIVWVGPEAWPWQTIIFPTPANTASSLPQNLLTSLAPLKAEFPPTSPRLLSRTLPSFCPSWFLQPVFYFHLVPEVITKWLLYLSLPRCRATLNGVVWC